MSRRVLGIIGTGLIGASIGLRSRELNWFVLGADTDSAALDRAQTIGAIDEPSTADEIVMRADILVLAPPPAATIAELARLRGAPNLRAELILDVASVKAPIVAASEGIVHFVATHPLAGSERSGPDAASAELFAGCAWALVPSGDGELDARARAFVSSMNATPFAIDAGEHDRIVALTSHLPQVVAFALATRMEELDPRVLDGLSGPVARELRRIGTSDRRLWREILHFNRANVAREARALAAALAEIADSLERDEVSA